MVHKLHNAVQMEAGLICPAFSLIIWIGGEVTVEKDLSSVSLGPNPMPELAHVIVGLESPSHQVWFTHFFRNLSLKDNPEDNHPMIIYGTT